MKKYWEQFRLLFKKYIFIKGNSVYDLLIHLGIVISLMAVMVLFFFNAYLPATTHHRETVTVPDLVNMSVDEAEKFLSQRDLEYVIADSSFSKTHKPYVVLTQSPEAGARVKQNRKIRLTINPKIPPKVRLPLVTDMPFPDALRILKNANLELGKIKYKPYVGENVVLEQFFKGKEVLKAEIEAGVMVPMGTKIDLMVGDGLGETEFNMPDLVGLNQEEAELVLKGSDLVLGTVNYDFKSRRELGTVVRQSPTPFVGKARQGVKAGSQMDDRERFKVRAGDLVDVWVAGNPAARPSKDDKDDDDSLYRNSNERNAEDFENILKKRKGLDPPKETPKKDKKPSN